MLIRHFRKSCQSAVLLKKSKHVIRYNKDKLFRTLTIFLLAFPHLKPDSVVALWPTVDLLYNAGRIGSLLVILFLTIQKKRPIKTTLVLIFAVEIWLTITTLIQKTMSLRANLVYFGSAIAIPLLIHCYSDHMSETIDALFMNYEWLMYASLITVILYYPKGLYRKEVLTSHAAYFLGNENQIIFFAIPAICLALLLIKKNRRRIRALILIAICIANEVIVWCATGLVGLAAALLVFLCASKKGRVLNYYSVYFTTLFINILVSVFRIFDKNGFVSRIIINVLHKSLTLSGRTYIWDAAYPMIKKHLWTGLGRGSHIAMTKGTYHAHNQYFELLLEGGIPLLLLFFAMLFATGKSVSYTRKMTFGKKTVLAMLACIFVVFIAEQRITADVFIPFMLAVFVKQIDQAVEA